MGPKEAVSKNTGLTETESGALIPPKKHPPVPLQRGNK